MINIAEQRKQAHEAPMNTVGMDHKGHRFLLTHSMAWARASRKYFELLDKHEASQ